MSARAAKPLPAVGSRVAMQSSFEGGKTIRGTVVSHLGSVLFVRWDDEPGQPPYPATGQAALSEHLTVE